MSPPDRSEPAGPQTGQSFQNQSGAEEEGGTLLEEEGAGNDASEDAQETVRPQAVFNGRGGGGWDITSGQDTAPGAAGGETLLLLCLSGAVLAVGLLIASLYKKRG